MNAVVTSEVYSRNKIHPKKFALIAACAGMFMSFIALTSAYIVRQAAGNWLEFQLPAIFYYNTLVVIASSMMLHVSYKGFLKGRVQQYRYAMVAAFGLGLLFLALQYQGWVAMDNLGLGLTVNPSSSFIYLISGWHAAHILGGIGALTVALLHAFLLVPKVSEKRKLRFELTLIFWHFVDFLWVYLLVFFTIQS